MRTICGEDVMRRQKDSNTMFRNMGRSILTLHVQNVRQLFSQINKLKKYLRKCGNKIADFQCDQCRKTYRDKYLLDNHMKTDHPEPDHDVRAFICTKCGKSLRSLQSLKAHMKYFCHS